MCPHCLLRGLLETASAPRLGEQVGDSVGPYELIERIGEGGMGSVWRARQLHPVERTVALKIIRLGMDTREVVSRFDAERQSLAMMDHPGIAQVFEAGATETGRPYFAMELVEGMPVTDYCFSRKLGVGQRLGIFLEICEAVEHAHRKGVIHRDIKPSNVMVVERSQGPQVKVIDFGIAKLLEDRHCGRTFATQVGHVVGTPGYMSPEQAGGAPDVDTRSDVYSLGALLYEMLTGGPPLGKETFREVAHAEVMRLIRETDPPRPSTRAGAASLAAAPSPLRIARDLDRVVMKALARERDRRYGGATSLGADVQRFLNHEPVSATDPTLAYRAGKFVRKHRLAVACSVALLAAMAIGLLMTRREAERARVAGALAEMARLETCEVLSDSYRETGLAKAKGQRHADAALWFTQAAVEAAHDPGRRADNRLRAALHGDLAMPVVRCLERREVANDVLEFDATSRFLMELGSDTPPMVFDLRSGQPLIFEATLATAAFLPKLALLVFSSGDDQVLLRDLEDGSEQVLFEIEGETVSVLAVSADGDRILAGSTHPRVWSRGSGNFVSGPLKHPEPMRFASFSADGGQVLTVDCTDKLRIFPVAEGHPEPLFPPFTTDPRSIVAGDRFLTSRWADAGRILVKVDGRMVEVDAGSGELIGPEPRIGLGYDADVSHDGGLLVTPAGLLRLDRPDPLFRRPVGHARFLPDASGLYAMNTGEVLNLDGSLRGVTAPGGGHEAAFSPDGTLLAVRDAIGIRIHQLVQTEPIVRVHAPFAELVAVSADCSLIAHGGSRRPGPLPTVTQVFRLADGVPVGPILETSVGLRCATFVSAGDRLVTGGVEAATEEQMGEAPGVLQVWDPVTADRVAGPMTLPSEPLVIRSHPSEPWLAVLCRDGAILRVDSSLQHHETLLPGEDVPGDVRGAEVIFSSDGRSLHTSGPHCRVRSVDLERGELQFPEIRRSAVAQFLQLRGDTLFSFTNDRDDPWLIDARDGRPLEIPEALAGAYRAYGSELSADGSAVLFVHRDRVSVMDLATGVERGSTLMTGDEARGYSRFVPGTGWVVSAIAERGKPQALVVWDARSGAELSPRWPLGGRLRFGDLVVTADGRHAVASVKGEGFAIIDLAELRARARKPSSLPEDAELAVAELQAAREIVRGRSIRLDARRSWLPRWKAFRGFHLEDLPLKPSREQLLRWHRNQEAQYGPDGVPGRWHRARRKELGD
ncbi:serine/threonine-protein kinase PknD [Haloferula helveola]